MNRNPLLSVVVLTWNREKQALRCIDSILNSSYKKVEELEKLRRIYPHLLYIEKELKSLQTSGPTLDFLKAIAQK